MEVKASRELCMGQCMIILPSVFAFDESKKIEILNTPSVGDDILLAATENRLGKAVIIEDDESNQLFP